MVCRGFAPASLFANSAPESSHAKLGSLQPLDGSWTARLYTQTSRGGCRHQRAEKIGLPARCRSYTPVPDSQQYPLWVVSAPFWATPLERGQLRVQWWIESPLHRGTYLADRPGGVPLNLPNSNRLIHRPVEQAQEYALAPLAAAR